MKQDCTKIKEKLKELTTEHKAVVEWVKYNARHQSWCRSQDWSVSVDLPCTCGFDAVLAGKLSKTKEYE